MPGAPGSGLSIGGMASIEQSASAGEGALRQLEVDLQAGGGELAGGAAVELHRAGRVTVMPTWRRTSSRLPVSGAEERAEERIGARRPGGCPCCRW